MRTKTPDFQNSVQLADGLSASSYLHAVLSDAIAAFPNEINRSHLPESQGTFRKSYPDWLPQFEAARLASSERIAIARHMATVSQVRLVWSSEGKNVPIDEALAVPVPPLELKVKLPNGEPGWLPEIVYRGKRWEADKIADLGNELVQRGIMTPAAGDSLSWLVEHQLQRGGIQLSDRKLVVLGAAAEMASTRYWLQTGASVLWIDLVPPPDHLLESESLGGRLYWPTKGADLLTRPREVLATILEFADGDPVDICLYAYAPGQAREVRLTGVMNAIVNALPQEIVRSVTMPVSPTIPSALDDSDLAQIKSRNLARPVWESSLVRLGLLNGRTGPAKDSGVAVSRSVVGIQGASYQAAQYLGKLLMAECWANYGPPGSDVPRPLRVSANTAAITRTRSLDHPVFAAAFQGAAALGVETFTPRLSRSLNGLLAVCDWLHPEMPVPGSVRVHGGIHTLSYPLESALRVAAVFGFVRSPRLLRGLFRR